MLNENNGIWITWEKQLRNKSMSSKLNLKLYEMELSTCRIKRYLTGMVQTFLIIKKDRPKVIFAQNPSIILTIFLLFLRPFWGYKLASDSHFGGVTAYNGNKFFQKILDFCNWQADLVIVTNTEQAKYIESIGGDSFICEDPLPDLSRYFKDEPLLGKEVLFICSFDIDEPYLEVFKAADLLAEDGYKIYVSGNYRKVNIKPSDYPKLNFLGYLPEHLFYTKLFKSHVVVDLTTHENCLVCGAYEAMAAEKPLVTSNRRALRNYFKSGTVFTNHDKISIANAIKDAFHNRQTFKDEIKDWKLQAVLKNNDKIVALHELVSGLIK